MNANEWSGNANLFFGQKILEEENWGDADEQTEFGGLVDFKQSHWPVSIAIDILGSKDFLDFTTEGSTTEFDIGVRKIWDAENGAIRTYIGGGLAFISAEITSGGFFNNSVSQDDSGTGIWFGGGINWTLGQHYNLGIDLRYSQADVTLFDENVDAGGTQVGMILGYHW